MNQSADTHVRSRATVPRDFRPSVAFTALSETSNKLATPTGTSPTFVNATAALAVPGKSQVLPLAPVELPVAPATAVRSSLASITSVRPPVVPVTLADSLLAHKALDVPSSANAASLIPIEKMRQMSIDPENRRQESYAEVSLEDKGDLSTDAFLACTQEWQYLYRSACIFQTIILYLSKKLPGWVADEIGSMPYAGMQAFVDRALIVIRKLDSRNGYAFTTEHVREMLYGRE